MGIEYIECNLSVVQCAYDHLAQDFIAIMEKYHVDANDIVLEITESASITEKKILLDNMNALRKVGVRFALDDFGMGYAGLHQLQQMKALPVDILKIDKVFIDMLPEDVSMVPAMIQLARGMSLRIVAEGVENDAQRRWLQAAGVEVLQGHLFGCALPQEAFSARYLSPVREDANL